MKPAGRDPAAYLQTSIAMRMFCIRLDATCHKLLNSFDPKSR
jgi:hypothetical protein